MIAPVWVMAKTLKQLLLGVVNVSDAMDRKVSGLQLDSRKVTAGEVFIALSGTHQNGLDFALSAIEQGAVAIIHDEPIDRSVNGELLRLAKEKTVPLLHIPNARAIVSEMAGRFYGNPSQSMGVVGVTGTDGKTSVSHFVAQALTAIGKQAAVIGTVGNGILGTNTLQTSTHTTPDPISLQALLSDLRQHSASHVAMEVSSHALDQHRVDAVAFDIAVFTNLGRDHMDYHKSMHHYAETKKRLFTMSGLQGVVINCDDDFGNSMAQMLCHEKPVCGYGFDDLSPNFAERIQGHNLELSASGIAFDVSLGGSRNRYHVTSSLLGEFNAHNILATIGVLVMVGVPLVECVEIVHRLHPVDGRMVSYRGENAPTVVVDFAHTPQALASVLKSLKAHQNQGQLKCVFGCGGDRDKGKRAEMGQAAATLADHVVITSDNPRSEHPQAIAQDILQGMGSITPDVELDRAKAIANTIAQSSPNDIVLIAGKGHETYQIIGEQTLAFSDAEQVEKALASQKELS